MPRYAASRPLPARLDEVWAFLAEPANLAAWWPGIAEVEAGRQGLVPGARWQVVGPNRPSYLRRPQLNGMLLVLEVAARKRVAFQLPSERIDAELDLHTAGEDVTGATLTVEAPWLSGVRRSFPRAALARLADRVRS